MLVNPVGDFTIIPGRYFFAGLAYPLPYGGLQIQDFNFRGRGEQLRALIAGVLNDAAWVSPRGRTELNARAFVQLLPLASSMYEHGREVTSEEVRETSQRFGVGAARSLGPVRFNIDLGVNRLDFWRTDNTAANFVLPKSTFEWVGRLEVGAALGATTLSASGEAGHRQRWEAWGLDGGEKLEPSWQRGRLAVVWEKAPLPLTKLHLDAELWVGRHLDRFSAISPGRFGGLHLRGIASSRLYAEAVLVTHTSIAVPLSPRVRGEAGVDLAWAREERSGYRARPLSGVGVGISAPGPWRTLLQAGAGVALATPGKRSVTFELFLLRPLGRATK